MREQLKIFLRKNGLKLDFNNTELYRKAFAKAERIADENKNANLELLVGLIPILTSFKAGGCYDLKSFNNLLKDQFVILLGKTSNQEFFKKSSNLKSASEKLLVLALFYNALGLMHASKLCRLLVFRIVLIYRSGILIYPNLYFEALFFYSRKSSFGHRLILFILSLLKDPTNDLWPKYNKFTLCNSRNFKLKNIVENKICVVCGPSDYDISIMDKNNIVLFVTNRLPEEIQLPFIPKVCYLGEAYIESLLQNHTVHKISGFDYVLVRSLKSRSLIKKYNPNCELISRDPFRTFWQLNAIQEICELLCAISHSNIFVTGATLLYKFDGRGTYNDQYFKMLRPVRLQFIGHDPFMNFLYMRKLFYDDRFNGDVNLKKVLKLPFKKYVENIYKSYF